MLSEMLKRYLCKLSDLNKELQQLKETRKSSNSYDRELIEQIRKLELKIEHTKLAIIFLR